MWGQALEKAERRQHYKDLFESDGWLIFRADVANKMAKLVDELMALPTGKPEFAIKAAGLINAYAALKSNVMNIETRMKQESIKANQRDSSEQ